MRVWSEQHFSQRLFLSLFKTEYKQRQREREKKKCRIGYLAKLLYICSGNLRQFFKEKEEEEKVELR